MNQHPLWLEQQQSQYPQKAPHLYSWQTLAGLIALYIVSCILFGIANGGTSGTNLNNESAVFSVLISIGTISLLALHVVIFLIDGQNFLTLNGKILWRSLNGWARVGLVFVYFGFWIMPPIYLVLAVKYFWEAKRQPKALEPQSVLGQNMSQQTRSYSQVAYTPRPTYVSPEVTVAPENEAKPLAFSSQRRTKVFISYSHKDEKYLQRLHIHFAHYERMGIIEVWDDTKLSPGALWQEEIKDAIVQTKVALLLVSADYLASQFIAENELPPLLRAAQTKGATIIPVILSACAFDISGLAQFQAINSPTKPLSSMSWDEKEKLWATVVKMVSGSMNLR